jgi:hypothetical protein
MAEGYPIHMNVKLRTIEIDARTADLLEARAAARGLTVPELLADLAAGSELLPADLEAERTAGTGAWAPEVLAEDSRRLASFMRAREGVPWNEVEAWIKSWGTVQELPAPRPRKL